MTGNERFISSARVTSILTFLSRLAGLVREYVFSHFFGTGELLSAFRIAFVIPNLARRLFGEGALSAAVIPVLTTTIQDRGDESSRGLVGSLLLALSVILGGGLLLAEAVAWIWLEIEPDPAVRLTAVTLPYMPMICVVALLSGVLNVRGYFAGPAAAPIVFNVVVIGATLVGAWLFQLQDAGLMNVLCLSVLAGGAAQLGLVAWDMHRAKFWPTWGLGLRDPRLRSVARLMAPMFLGLSAVQINTFSDSIIAYLFIEVNGERIGPAVLSNAQFLYQFPLGVFGIGLATAIFPLLSRQAAARDRSGLADALQRGVRLSLFIALPATVGLLFTAHPLVAAVYEHGAFTAADTQRVAAALRCYSIGLCAYFLQHVIIRVFYALQDSKTPARIALGMVVLNLGLNLALVVRWEERGLAFSTALCAMVQMAWLGKKLLVVLPEVPLRTLLRGVGRSGLATVVMTLTLWAAASVATLQGWIITRPLVGLSILVGTGVLAYTAAARFLRSEELVWLLHRTPTPRPASGFVPNDS